MHYHQQNLNERATTKEPYIDRFGDTLIRYHTTYGSIVRAGRAWLHFGERVTLAWEWHFFPKHGSLGNSMWHDNVEGEWGVSLKLGFCALYLKLEAWHWFRAKGKRYSEKELSWSIHDGALWWNFWMDVHEHRASDPKWRRGAFHPLDVFFGRQKYNKQVLSTHQQAVEFPEGVYPVVIELEHCTWTRPRWPGWPLLRQGNYATVDVHDGIPVPGKGENSWDCDDDAIFSMSTNASTVEEAIANLHKRIDNIRERRGGLNWQPPKRSA